MKSFQFLVAALLLVSSSVVLAEKPDPNVPNPPLQVQEYNVDADGYIAVHEQGTADVHVTGGQIDATITGGSVTVDNTDSNPVPVTVGNTGSNPVPVTVENAEQDVYVVGGEMNVPTKVWNAVFGIKAGDDSVTYEFSVGTIYATTIHVADGNDETIVEFFSPMTPDVAFAFWDHDGAFIEHTHSFTYPIPINAVRVSCQNESESCSWTISVWGF